MGEDAGSASLIQALVLEEIRAIVSEAISKPTVIASGPLAWRLSRTYPACGLDPVAIAQEIAEAAAASGVAVELSRPRAPDYPRPVHAEQAVLE
ncbi:hypothetical protein SAMN05216548_10971 [Faunimonas pinastri]|uniref:Uncharacterized protein n=1 Tax=Faunimonas pinastri TaxID=1855383 RepID=A0A1H9K4I1_9HYPH|nr:hypothetical protein [Faunimonas pinastri]SEQ93827.1 hypothetical protein SAMN05216548_10971 [Faunimonas pinastri]